MKDMSTEAVEARRVEWRRKDQLRDKDKRNAYKRAYYASNKQRHVAHRLIIKMRKCGLRVAACCSRSMHCACPCL